MPFGIPYGRRINTVLKKKLKGEKGNATDYK
jgi:hypothetical protein